MTEYLNIVDEKSRFVELNIYPNSPDRQGICHTYSYLYMRNVMKHEFGDVMGFDRIEELIDSGELLWNEEGYLLSNSENKRRGLCPDDL